MAVFLVEQTNLRIMKKVILSAAVFCIAGLGTAMAQGNDQNLNQSQTPPRTDTVTTPPPTTPPAGQPGSTDVQTTPATPGTPATGTDTPRDKADRKSRDKDGAPKK